MNSDYGTLGSCYALWANWRLVMKRWLAMLSILVGSTLSPGCNCDDPIIIKVAPMLQIQHADADTAEEDPLA